MSMTLKSGHLNYSVLEEASGLSPEDFGSFWATIQTELREPKNSIGLNGPKKSSVGDYEDWIDQFIAGGIGELGWGNGVTERQYGRKSDMASIRRFVRLLVGYVSASLRATDRRSKATNELKVAQKPTKPARRPAVERAIVIDSDGEDFDTQGQAFAQKILTATHGESAQPGHSITTSHSPLCVGAVTGALDSGVFRTKISPFGPTKFVYTDNAATITEFLDVARRKWEIPLHTRAKSIRVAIDGQEICVDITEERDWVVVKRLMRNGSGIADALIDFIH